MLNLEFILGPLGSYLFKSPASTSFRIAAS